MFPFIRPKDVVYVLGPPHEEVRLGDVVALRTELGNGLLVHRVVARVGEELLLRGDSRPAADGCYKPEDVLGVVTRVERDGRAVWSGAGRLGRPVAWAVRHGLIWRGNRIYFGARRLVGRCLKFRAGDSRLREHKGNDGNE